MPATSVVVLSGKGGTAKTLWQITMAGEASRAGIKTLLIDVDPERNLSNRFGISQHSTGLGNVLIEAGVMTGEFNDDAIDNAGEAFVEEIVSTPWDNVDLLPAGAQLPGVSQVTVHDLWLLRRILTAGGVYDRYDLVLFDTGGRTGSLVSMAMYAADVSYAPIAPTGDAVRKAAEAKARVERIQRSHQLRWAGVVLSNFDTRTGIEDAIRQAAYQQFGDEVRAEVPRRAAVNEAFQLCQRLGDRTDVATRGIAQIFHDFLVRDLMERTDANIPAGALR